MKRLAKYEILDPIYINKQHSFNVELCLDSYILISKGSSLISAEQLAPKFLVNFLEIDIEKLDSFVFL